MNNRTKLVIVTALLVTSAVAQAADHREAPALSAGSLAVSTSTGQSNGASRGGYFQTEMISLSLSGE